MGVQVKMILGLGRDLILKIDKEVITKALLTQHTSHRIVRKILLKAMKSKTVVGGKEIGEGEIGTGDKMINVAPIKTILREIQISLL